MTEQAQDSLWQQAKQRRYLRYARESVISAAKAWVNFEDDGLAKTAHLQERYNSRLVKAVTRLEKLEARDAG
jgi:hypothetical protein